MSAASKVKIAELLATWRARWREADFTWEGLRKHELRGWVVADGLLYEAENGRLYGQPILETPRPVKGVQATLQDYWRVDPATGRLRDDAAMGAELVAASGQPTYHVAHLPTEYDNSTATGKADWDVAALDAIVLARLHAADETRWEGESYERRIAGADRDAQFQGGVWLKAPRHPSGSERALSVRHDLALFLGYCHFQGVTFSGETRFAQAAFGDEVRFHDATFTGGARFDLAIFCGPAWFYSAAFQRAGFVGAVFNDLASFGHMTVGGAANFEQASFGGEAHFDKTRFGKFAHFREATFGGNASFGHASFAGDAMFQHAAFDGKALFAPTTFGADGNFESATFGDEGWFVGARFSGEARFSAATFNRDASFDKARFEAGAWFGGVAFSGATAFKEADFRDEAFFEGAAFDGKARFDQAIFDEGATFSQTSFRSEASFDSARFSRWARFENAFFGGDVAFRLSQFRSPACFDGAQFRSGMDFASTVFDRFASFVHIGWPSEAAHWHGAFEQVVFRETLSLVGAGFGAFAAFDGATLERGVQLDDADEAAFNARFEAEVRAALAAARGDEERLEAHPGAHRDWRLRQLVRGCRVVRRAFERAADTRRAQALFRLELKARRAQRDLACGEALFLDLYALAADYGASLVRPLIALAALIPVFGAVYLAWGFARGHVEEISGGWMNAAWQALDFSWANVFNPLSALTVDRAGAGGLADKLLFDRPGLSFALRAVATLQSLIALALAALFALALRRRFQLG